ncbi:hypothetical protein OPQ81_000494 [Rhizoctonia solani]|nr:hypothetical protein OPQ81_000494 [Rhizoctonia solani]
MPYSCNFIEGTINITKNLVFPLFDLDTQHSCDPPERHCPPPPAPLDLHLGQNSQLRLYGLDKDTTPYCGQRAKRRLISRHYHKADVNWNQPTAGSNGDGIGGKKGLIGFRSVVLSPVRAGRAGERYRRTRVIPLVRSSFHYPRLNSVCPIPHARFLLNRLNQNGLGSTLARV